jgi:chorismate dehydratase
VTPAQCARLFKEGIADISLCPVGALKDMPPHDIVGKYCIGADGEVKTVLLLSKVPLDEIRAVRLDDHSRTSNVLLEILAQQYWKKDWTYYTTDTNGHTESCLMIGDKVFEHSAQYPFQYDLADAWKSLTGLPLVFAVWIARPGIEAGVAGQLDQAFERGMEWLLKKDPPLEPWQIEYLTRNISYPFDELKQKALFAYQERMAALEYLREGAAIKQP